MKAEILARDKHQCVVCHANADDVHHIVKRSHLSQEAADQPSNLVSVCRTCHIATDNPYRIGRLVISSPTSFAWVYAKDKWDARAR